jgi:hypothetical protein
MITKYDAVLALVGLEKNFGVTANGVLEWYESSNEDKPTEAQIQAKIAELKAAEPMRLLRIQRNHLLAQTDWRFRSDLTPSQAWIDYCQALRDLPANSTPALDENGQLTGVNWPTPPES